MKSFVGGLIALILSVSVGAEPLLEGRVRLSSGQPAVGVQVRLFDLTDLRRFVGTTTDEAGRFALPLRAFSTARGTALPNDFALGQNYPNPFNPSTIIPYQIPASAHVRLEVFNLLGQRLATLVDGVRSAGTHTAQWDGTDVAGRAVGAGVYIYRLSGGGVTVSRRMVLVDGQAGIPAVGTAAQGTVWSAVEGSVEADGSVYGLTVSGQGLVPYVNPAFRVGIDEADIVIEEFGGIPLMKRAAGGILGDVNNDGQVDLFDALYVMLYSEAPSIALPNHVDISLGDVNGDGTVDFADALILIQYSEDPSNPALPPGIGEGDDCAQNVVGESNTSNNCSDAVRVIVSQMSQIYWTSAGRVQRANLDGSNIEDLVTGLGWAHDLALDVAGGKMYWTDDGEIQRANLDGSNIEDLVTGLNFPQGLALDVARGKMYWTDDGEIQRANLDGSNIEDLVTGLDSPFDLALDVAGGKMYWTDGEIQRANLDGSNIEDLVTGLDSPLGLALDVAGGKMYWTEFYRSGTIRRTNLDGSNIEDLITGLDFPFDLALDVAEGKMYWTEFYRSGTIRRTNLDGSNIEDLVTGLNFPQGLALDLSGAAGSGTGTGNMPVEESQLTPEIIALYGTLVTTFTDIFFAALVPGTTSVPGEGGSVEIAGNDWTFQDYSPDGALVINGTLNIGIDQTSIPLTGTVTFSGSQEAELELDIEFSIGADGTLSATGTITINGAEFDVAEISEAAEAAARG